MLIGQKITVTIQCDEGGISAITWAVPSVAVRNYVVVNDPANKNWSATLTHLDAAYLSQASISFYWCTPGTKTITVNFTVTIGGNAVRCAKSMTFDVRAPSVETTQPTSIGIPTAIQTPAAGVKLLRSTPFGYIEGMVFTAAVTTPVGWTGGLWQFTQLVNVDLIVSYANINSPNNPCVQNPDPNLRRCFSTTGSEARSLDDTFAYPTPPPEVSPPFAADGTAHFAQDSPNAFSSPVIMRQMNEEANFFTYIMYQPPDPGSGVIWVPLQVLVWGFSFCAIPNAIQTAWVVKDKESDYVNWADYPSHPTWSKQLPSDYQTICVECPDPCSP